MNHPKTQDSPKNKTGVFTLGHFVLAVLSCCALLATFLAASSAINPQTKLIVFLCIVFSYLFCCAAFYWLQKRRLSDISGEDKHSISKGVFNSEVESKLLALEEANEFFGASLKSADMFRLVSSRIKEIIPFAGSVLFMADEKNSRLKAIFADGENAQSLLNIETDFKQGIVGSVFTNGKSRIDENLPLNKSAVSAALKDFNSAVSVPLLRDAEVFGVLTLYGKNAKDFDADSLQLLEAVGTRVAPLFLSSFAFEKSLSNALTDALTNLPNERAFYLILENQIAESQRFRETRPLTILTVDIKNFSEFNQKYGHAAGNNILAFAAKKIKEQMREMDFLARFAGDEFIAVLPTAGEEITKEIVERLEKAFISNPFTVSSHEKVYLQLNFGAATFWKDGETTSQLLQHAQLRRKQSKSTGKSKVLWFPKEYVN